MRNEPTLPMIVNVIDHDRGGGAERLVGDLAVELVGRGWSVRNIYFCPESENPGGLGTVPRLYLDSIGRPITTILRLRRALSDIRRAHDQVIVHAHLARPLYWVPVAAAGLGCILVFSEHSTLTRRRRIEALRRVERVIYSRYARIVCVSEAVRTSLADWIGELESFVLIPNGSRLLPVRNRPFRENGPARFVSVGRLIPQKGFDRTLRALACIGEIDWRYTIVGQGAEEDALRQLARSLGVADRVTFAGWQDDIQPFLCAADIQLIPSRREPFGLVAVEGMSTGLTVIASDVPGLREVIGADGGLLVHDPDSLDAWVSLIRRTFDELAFGPGRQVAAARRRAERFSLDHCVEAHAALYREAADRLTHAFLAQ
jgi:glycosyltransferase involved in cell wall biosynthesis